MPVSTESGGAASLHEEVLLQLTNLGFPFGAALQATKAAMTLAEGHLPKPDEKREGEAVEPYADILEQLLKSHSQGDMAQVFASAGVSAAKVTDDLLSDTLPPPPMPSSASLLRAPPPPKLQRTKSTPEHLQRRWHSRFPGASLASVTRLLLQAAVAVPKLTDAAAAAAAASAMPTALELKLQLQAGNLDEIRTMLRKVYQTSDSQDANAAKSIECPICFETVEGEDIFRVPCASGHSFCKSCMCQHVEIAAFPRCPEVKCGYEFIEEDVLQACGEGPRVKEYREFLLRRALAQVHGQVACPNPACKNVVICDPDRRTRVVCPCGQPPFCSMCREPFHHHVDCALVQSIRQQYLEWISHGRRVYLGNLELDSEATVKRQEAVRTAIDRHKELAADEQWKAEHCRLCPKCCKPIQRTQGCSSMKCGENYHGGNKQPGCGHNFTWDTALTYVPRVDRHQDLPSVGLTKLKGAYVKHFFTNCSLCQQIITGPRFKCIQCEHFDCCVNCEGKLDGCHEADHVFQLVLEPSDPINEDLPPGTEVEVFGLEDAQASLNGVVAKILRYIPQIKVYDLDLPFGGGKPIVPAANVQPSSIQTMHDAQGMLEMMLGQQEARRFYLGLKTGQQIQLTGAEDPELENQVGTIDGVDRGRCYRVKLLQPPQWSCRKCTLRNDASATRCDACRTQRGKDQGQSLQVNLSHVSPLIKTAAEVKTLAQMHMSEFDYLAKVEMANAECAGCNLDLPSGLLVEYSTPKAAASEEATSVLKVEAFDIWEDEYDLAPENERKLFLPYKTLAKASNVRPLFFNEENLDEMVALVQTRHAQCQKRKEAALLWEPKLVGCCLGLQVGQWVSFEATNAPKKDALVSWVEALGDYTEEDAHEYQLVHGVRPPPRPAGAGTTAPVRAPTPTKKKEYRRGIIMEVCHGTQRYKVKPYREISTIPFWLSMEEVTPNVFKAEDPDLEGEALLQAHRNQSEWNAGSSQLAEKVKDCNLGLEADSWVKVLFENESSLNCQVEYFDRWACNYKLKRPPFPVEDFKEVVEPHEICPLLVGCELNQKVQKIREQHEVEFARRLAVVEANALAASAGVSLALKAGAGIEVFEQGSGCKTDEPKKMVVATYNSVVAACSATPYSVVQAKSVPQSTWFDLFTEEPRFRPVYWLEDDPLAAAKAAIEQHRVEEARLRSIRAAEEETKDYCMGLEAGALVWATTHDTSIQAVKTYLPTTGQYLLAANPFGKSNPSTVLQYKACSEVRPCFRQVDDVADRVSQRKAEHENEMKRLEEVRLVEAVMEERVKETGGLFLGMPIGHAVRLVGEGQLRKPDVNHTGCGTITAYNAERRTYTVKLDVELDGAVLNSCGSSNLHSLDSVRAQDLRPVLLAETDPRSQLEKLFELSRLAKQRREVVQQWIPRLSQACLNFPPKTFVTHGPPEATFEIQHFCLLTQTYYLRPYSAKGAPPSKPGTALTKEKVPASQVRPYLWEAEDPAKQGAALLEAHTQEAKRLEAVLEAETKLARQSLRGIPAGMPVRLLKPVTVAGLRKLADHLRIQSRGQQSVFSRFMDTIWGPSVGKGCKAGDIAYVKTAHNNGTYTLAICESQIFWSQEHLNLSDEDRVKRIIGVAPLALQVPASSVQPLFIASASPTATLAQLLECDKAAVCAGDQTSRIEQQIASRAFLNLPPGTKVWCEGKGVGHISWYIASLGEYVVKSNSLATSGLFMATAAEVHVQLTDVNDINDVVASFERRHEAEVVRLERAKLVNDAVRGGEHLLLPPSTRVIVEQHVLSNSTWAQLGMAASRTRVGTVLGVQEGSPRRYNVLMACWDQTGISSASHTQVEARHVRPTFWDSPDPIEALRQLDPEAAERLERAESS